MEGSNGHFEKNCFLKFTSQRDIGLKMGGGGLELGRGVFDWMCGMDKGSIMSHEVPGNSCHHD